MGQRGIKTILGIIGALALLSGCSSLPRYQAHEAAVFRSPQTGTLADSLWSQRFDPTAARMALNLYDSLAHLDSSSLQLWAHLSHARYFVANYLEEDLHLKDSLFLQGYEDLQQIISRNSTYEGLLFSTGDEGKAIQTLGEEYTENLYWGIANYGQWLATKGELIRLGQRRLVLSTLEHVHELDSSFYFGGYDRFLGAVLCRDPLVTGDLSAAEAAFRRSMQAEPDYLGTYTLMAGFYARRTHNRELYYSLLTKVMTANPEPDRPYYPENLMEKRRAELLLIQAERENWFLP